MKANGNTLTAAPLFPSSRNYSSSFQRSLSDSFGRADTSTGGAGTTTGAGNGWIDNTGGIAQITSGKLVMNKTSGVPPAAKEGILRRPDSEAQLNQRIKVVIPGTEWASPSACMLSIGLRYKSSSGDCIFCQIRPGQILLARELSGVYNEDGTVQVYSNASNHDMQFEVWCVGSLFGWLITDLSTGATLYRSFTISDSTLLTSGTAVVQAGWSGGTSCKITSIEIGTMPSINIGLLGDSILAGDGTSNIVSSSPMIQTCLEFRLCGAPVTLSNQAIGGKASGDWAVGQAIYTTAKAAFASASCKVVLYEIGDNDANAAVSKATFKSNVSGTVNDLLAGGTVQCVILCPPPTGYGGTYGSYQYYLDQYRVAMQELSNGSTIIFADQPSRTIALYRPDYTYDNIHFDKTLGIWGHSMARADWIFSAVKTWYGIT